MDNNLQNLYNSLSNQVDIGTFESFSSKMKTKEERKAFYNSIRQAGFDLGDYGKYENRLKKKDSAELEGGFGETAQASTDILKEKSLKKKSIPELAKEVQQESSLVIGAGVGFNPEIFDQQLKEKNPVRIPEPDETGDKDIGNVKSMWSKFQSGSARLGSGIARIPSFIYDIASIPQNLLAKLPGLSGLEVTSPEWLKDNPVAKYYDKQVELLNETTKQYNKTITGYLKMGDYGKALGLLGNEVAETLPLMMGLALGGASGVTATQSITGMGLLSGAEKKKELEDVDMDEVMKTWNAIVTGLAEGAMETMGTVKIAAIGKQLYSKVGKEAAEKAAKDGFKATFGNAIKKFYPISGAIGEGIEEASTTFTQNLTDRYTGLDPERNPFDGVTDAFIVGTTAGGGMTMTISAAGKVKQGLEKKGAVELKQPIIELEPVDFLEDKKEPLEAIKKPVKEVSKESKGEVPLKEEKLLETPKKGQTDIKSQLNEAQIEQYDEMIKEYGAEEATRRIKSFIPEVEKYTIEPEEYAKKGKPVKPEIKEPEIKEEKIPSIEEMQEYEASFNDYLNKRLERVKKRSKKEAALKSDLFERVSRISEKIGAKKSLIPDGEKDVALLEDIYKSIEDMVELGIIKVEEGVDALMDALKVGLPPDYKDKLEGYREDVAKKYGLEYKPPSKYRKVFESIQEREYQVESYKKKNKIGFGKWFNKLVTDKPENFRSKLLKVDKELGQRACDFYNLQAGMSGKSKLELEKARKDVLGNYWNILSRGEQDLLSEYIDNKRVIELDNLYDKRKEKRLQHEGGLNKELSEEFIKGIKNKDSEILARYNLDDVDINKLEKSSEAFYGKMQELLDRRYENGLITEEAYNKLKEEQPYYSPRKYIQHVNDYDTEGSLSGIAPLKGGSQMSKVVDIQTMLSDNISRTNNAVMANKARNAIADIGKNFPDNPYIKSAKLSLDYFTKLRKESVKPKGERKYIEPTFENTPEGYESVDYLEDGKKRRFFIDESLHSEFINEQDPVWLNKTKNILSWVTLTKPLKMAATGYNPEFMVRNIPLDMMHILTTTEEYNPIYAIGTPQLLNDMRKVFPDAVARKGRFKDYVNEGGSMEYLTMQGSFNPVKFKKYNKLTEGLKAVAEGAAYLGNTSEILTRLALRERYINNRLKELKRGGFIPTKEQLQEIQYRATAYARNYLDFSQGGHATKIMDSMIPYLNAGIQVTRGTFRSAKRNPKVFWFKVGQLGAISAGIAAYNMGMFKGGDDEEKQERANYYLHDISDREKANSFVLMTPFSFYDKQMGSKRYLYLRLPKDHTQQLITGLFEDIYLKYVHGVEDKQILNNRRFKELQAMFKSVGDLASMPPTISALVGYKFNIDDFYGTSIWYGSDLGKDKSQEFYPGVTPERFIKWGELTKMSPERTRYAAQQVFTNSNIMGSMLGEGLDYLSMGVDKELKVDLDKHTIEKFKNAPFIRRFAKLTNPNVGRTRAKEEQQKYNRVKTTNNNKLQQMILNKDHPDKVADWIVKQEPYEVERLFNRYVDRIEAKEISTSIKKLAFYAPEVRAKEFYNMYKERDEEKRIQLVKDSKKLGGIITKGRFQNELLRLITEDEELKEEYNKIVK